MIRGVYTLVEDEVCMLYSCLENYLQCADRLACIKKKTKKALELYQCANEEKLYKI